MDIIIYFFILCIGCCQKCLILNKLFVQKSHRHLFRLCWTQLVCKINLCLVSDLWTSELRGCSPSPFCAPQSCFAPDFTGEVHGGPVAFSVKCQVWIKHNLPQYFHLPGASSYWDSLSGARKNRYDEICVHIFHTYLNARPRLSNEW